MPVHTALITTVSLLFLIVGCGDNEVAPNSVSRPDPKPGESEDVDTATADTAPATVAEHVEEWESVGPGGGGKQIYPAISPNDPSLLFVACDMGGFYRSADSGKTWRMHGTIRRSTHAPVFHPTDPDVVFVSTFYQVYDKLKITGGWRVWKSDDRGQTWTIQHDRKYDDYSTKSVTALLIDPDVPDRMWALLGQPDPTSIIVSDDGGKSWNNIGRPFPASRSGRLFVDASSDSDTRRLYAHVGNAAFVSIDSGGSWNPVSTEIGRVIDLCAVAAVNAEQPTMTLYVIGPSTGEGAETKGAIRRSTDGGETWTDLSSSFVVSAYDDGKVMRMRNIVGNQARPEVIYVSADIQNSRGVYSYGIYKSTDAGDSWKFLFPSPETRTALRVHKRDAETPDFDPGWASIEFRWSWGGTAHDMTVSQSNSDHFLRTDMGRTIGTQDGGRSWRNLYSNRAEQPGHYGSRGLETTTCYRVVFDPHNDQRMWTAYTDIGNWRSDDRGKTWQFAMTGSKFTNTMYELRADPDIPDRLYGACSNTHDIPMWRYLTRDPKTFTGGFCISNDGGLTWKMSGEGLPNAACTSLAIDPRNDPNNRTLYLIAFGRGLYKSEDSGKSWQLKVSGMESILEQNEHLYTLELAPDGTLYTAITKRVRQAPGKPRDSRGGALFISEDGAESWKRIGPQLPEQLSRAPNDFSKIWDIAASPHNADEIIVACSLDVHSRTGALGGLYRSRDKGRTWQRIFDDSLCYRVSYHPTDPQVLFCGTGRNGLFWSPDGGATWNNVEGIPFKTVYRTTVDPTDSTRIWVTTFGGGVWTGHYTRP